MEDNFENKKKSIKKDEEKHVCSFRYISSSEGSYKICRDCGKIIILVGKSY